MVHAAALPLLPGLRSTLAALPSQIRLDATLLPPPEPAVRPKPAPRSEPPLPRRPHEPQRTQPRPQPVEAQAPALTAPAAEPPAEPGPILAAPPASGPSPAVARVAAPPTQAAVQAMPAAVHPAVPLDDLQRGFGQALARSLAAQRRYPRVAQMRGWQGTVEIEIEFLANGRVGNAAVVRSSGHEVLDDQALRMLREAELPLRPDPLRERGFTLRVPIEFRLRG